MSKLKSDCAITLAVLALGSAATVYGNSQEVFNQMGRPEAERVLSESNGVTPRLIALAKMDESTTDSDLLRIRKSRFNSALGELQKLEGFWQDDLRTFDLLCDALASVGQSGALAFASAEMRFNLLDKQIEFARVMEANATVLGNKANVKLIHDLRTDFERQRLHFDRRQDK